MPADSSCAPAPDARLTLQTLGGWVLRAQAPGEPARVVFDAGKPLAIVTYLALSPERAASRARLLDLLWANAEPEAARNSLRVTLSALRRRLGADALGPATDPVTLSAPVESDHAALVDAWERRDPERVVALYAGDFLPDIALSGGDRFHEWADVERARLRLVFARAAETVVRASLAGGRSRDAIALARRVRDLDRLAQAGWCLLLEALVAGRDRIGAAVEADALERLLTEEEIEPEPATRELLRLARATPRPADTAAADHPAAPLAELVGREREFAAILAAWERAASGRHAHVHVVAPPGLGKSRLLDEAAARLRSLRARVVHVAARHGARDIPYAAASDLAARLGTLRGAGGVSPLAASALVALDPSLSAAYHAAPDPSTGDEALRRRALAVRELIATLTEDRPLALLVDDLHWCDPLSRRLLGAVLGALDGARVLCLTAARPAGGDVPAADHATRLVLHPLDADAVATLLASLAPVPDVPWWEPLPAALRGATGGSPLLLLETLQLLRENGLLLPEQDRWSSPDPDALFETLHAGSALARRVASLDAAERRTLLALAVAGVPLPEETLRAAIGSDVDTAAALERRGLAVRTGDAWAAAHDEHASAILDSATPNEVQSVAGALGRTLAAGTPPGSPADPRRLRLAAFLLALGDDRPTLERVFARFVRDARRDGDGSPNHALARDLLGPTASGEIARALVGSLPWHVRTRLDTPPRVAAAAGLALLLLGGVTATALARRAAPPPLAMLLAVRPAAGEAAIDLFEVPLLPAAQAGETIEVDLRGRPVGRVPALPPDHSGQLHPGGRSWATTRDVGDSGTVDIHDVQLDGRTRRLTASRGDDMAGSWSPDGGRLVFETSQWTPDRHRLAVLDVATGVVSPLGPDSGQSARPMWSLDGSRIAFVHRVAGGDALCTVDVDGSGLRCSTPEPGAAQIGWLDAHRLVVRRGGPDSSALGWLNVDTGHEEPLGLGTPGEMPAVSPDGRWLVCDCVRRGQTSRARVVVRLDQPGDVRYLRVVRGDTALVTFTWSPASPRAPWIARVEIAPGPGLPMVGVTHQLRAVARDSGGRPTEAGVLRWRSLDTTVATVDAAGLLHPRRAGRLRVVASAGGWRADTVELRVRDPATRVLLDERWTGGLAPRWRPYGRPTPAIVRDTLFGLAFHNRGDTEYFSGAYTTAAFDTRDGLWVDAELSMPLAPGRPWQEQLVALHSVGDSARLARWDHETGDLPGGSGTMCRLHMPHDRLTDSLLIEHPERAAVLPMPPQVATGRPFRATVQVFPDGRCGYAIDDVALWIGDPAFDGRPARVRLEGRSVGLRNLVGQVRVHAGVAPHVRWDAPGSVPAGRD